MRVPFFGNPPRPDDWKGWMQYIVGGFTEISQTAEESVEVIIDDFTYTGTLTKTRTFDVDAATLDDVRQVLGTLIDDVKARGQKAGNQ